MRIFLLSQVSTTLWQTVHSLMNIMIGNMNPKALKLVWQAMFFALGLSLASVLFLAAIEPPTMVDHRIENKSNGCLIMRNVEGMEGKWIQQQGFHNGKPYYYNKRSHMYLYMTRPISDDPRLFYAVNPSLQDKSVLNGYCGEAGLDIMDCGGRWRADYVPNTASRFEPCTFHA